MTFLKIFNPFILYEVKVDGIFNEGVSIYRNFFIVWGSPNYFQAISKLCMTAIKILVYSDKTQLNEHHSKKYLLVESDRKGERKIS